VQVAPVLAGEDQSALLVLLSGLVPAGDAAMSRTVEMLSGVLSAPCGLLYRDEQAAAHHEGTSLLCTGLICAAAALHRG
jgi:GH15 family glucan-1,4-alpha-glucosidase